MLDLISQICHYCLFSRLTDRSFLCVSFLQRCQSSDGYSSPFQTRVAGRHGFVYVFPRAFPLISDKAPPNLRPRPS